MDVVQIIQCYSTIPYSSGLFLSQIDPYEVAVPPELIQQLDQTLDSWGITASIPVSHCIHSSYHHKA